MRIVTRIKVCGITSLDDALAAARAGVDALGFVFADSPRRIAPHRAREIVRRLPPFVRSVGVFGDVGADEARETAALAGVDLVQLHGTVAPRSGARLGRPVIRRLRVGEGDTRETLRRRMSRLGATAVLLDPGAGDGVPFRWEIARGLGRTVIVAGGLDPYNVATAVRQARPYAVDVARGVEEVPGCKSPAKLRAFVAAVRREDERRAAR